MTNEPQENWGEGLEELINDLRSNPSTDSVHIHEYVRETITQARAEERKKVVEEASEQKHYEIAMIIQAVEMFIEKDEDEYGTTPLHGKFKAFWEKYIAPYRLSSNDNPKDNE